MKNLYPSAMADRVYRITPQLLKSWGVRGLILDIDNTLTTHDNPIPDEGVADWLAQNRREGIQMIVLSNNKPHRVEPFAKEFHIFLAYAETLQLVARFATMLAQQLDSVFDVANRHKKVLRAAFVAHFKKKRIPAKRVAVVEVIAPHGKHQRRIAAHLVRTGVEIGLE